MKKNLLMIIAAMFIMAATYSCGGKEKEEPPLGPASNTLTIGSQNYDISAVKRNNPADDDTKFCYFKIVGKSAEGFLPAMYFKFPVAMFGRSIDISKTSPRMWFLYAELPSEESGLFNLVVDYENGYPRNQAAGGTLRIDEVSSKNYRIKFDATVDGTEYKCDFGGDISDIYFD